jgi:hypothetical protein
MCEQNVYLREGLKTVTDGLIGRQSQEKEG